MNLRILTTAALVNLAAGFGIQVRAYVFCVFWAWGVCMCVCVCDVFVLLMECVVFAR